MTCKEADDDVDELWQAEIARRVKELDEGTTKTVPWSEVRRQLIEQDETDR